MNALKKNLIGLGVASLLALPAAAFAQDSDSDGVANAADAFPCDATRASVSYFPGQSTSALLAFEDQWPNFTDVDYNDVAIRAHYRSQPGFLDAARLTCPIGAAGLRTKHPRAVAIALAAELLALARI